MTRKSLRFAICVGACLTASLLATSVGGAVITSAQVLPSTGDVPAWGAGNLGLVLFTYPNGNSAGNSWPDFTADCANTDMPTGNVGVACESYITSLGEIRQYYRTRYPNGSGGSDVGEIALLVEVNQNNPGNTLVVDKLELVAGYDAIYGDLRDNPAAGRVSSAQQIATGGNYSGGTLLASLAEAISLPEMYSGASVADYIIYTGVNPFSPVFTDDTALLVHWESHGHTAGGERIFLAPGKSTLPIPEPSALSLLMVVGVLAARR